MQSVWRMFLLTLIGAAMPLSLIGCGSDDTVQDPVIEAEQEEIMQEEVPPPRP